MAEFAYVCRPCDGSESFWYVARDIIAQMPATTSLVRVRVGRDWHCARLDRSEVKAVERMLIRDVVAATAAECPECATAPAPAARNLSAAEDSTGSAPPPTPERAARKVIAAAISVGGQQLFVVAAQLALVRDAFEADRVINELSERLGGIPILLMGQNEEDGAPAYYGDSQLVDLVAPLPLEKMPWKEYSLG